MTPWAWHQPMITGASMFQARFSRRSPGPTNSASASVANDSGVISNCRNVTPAAMVSGISAETSSVSMIVMPAGVHVEVAQQERLEAAGYGAAADDQDASGERDAGDSWGRVRSRHLQSGEAVGEGNEAGPRYRPRTVTPVNTIMPTDDPVAVAVVSAIRTGDTDALRSLLESHAGLSTVRLGDPGEPDGMTRTLMHVVADWPGHFPNGAATVAVLAELGADVNARFTGPHTETPLHWAASSDDVAVLDALLDAGADIEADGAVIAGGTPLSDAVAFAQWAAARRLVERGATVTLWQAAALGLDDRVGADSVRRSAAFRPTPIHHALWFACHGGQLDAARRLHAAGADVNWIPPWEHVSPLDAARRSGAFDVLTWLHGLGARSAESLLGGNPPEG